MGGRVAVAASFLALMTLLSESQGLRCYECRSANEDPLCLNPNMKNLATVDCATKRSERGLECDSCSMYVVSGNGKRVTGRACTNMREELMGCHDATRLLGVTVEFCGVCTHDGCNVAIPTPPPPPPLPHN